VPVRRSAPRTLTTAFTDFKSRHVDPDAKPRNDSVAVLSDFTAMMKRPGRSHTFPGTLGSFHARV